MLKRQCKVKNANFDHEHGLLGIIESSLEQIFECIFEYGPPNFGPNGHFNEIGLNQKIENKCKPKLSSQT